MEFTDNSKNSSDFELLGDGEFFFEEDDDKVFSRLKRKKDSDYYYLDGSGKYNGRHIQKK